MTRSRQGGGDAQLLRRVRLRLVAWSAALTAVVLLVLGGALYLGVNASLTNAAESQLLQQAQGAERFLERLPRGGIGFPEPRPGDVSFGRAQFGGPGAGTITVLVNADRDFVGAEPEDDVGLPVEEGVAAALEGDTDMRLATVGDSPVRVYSQPVEVRGDLHVLQIVQNRTTEQRTLDSLLRALVLGSLAAIALAGGVGFVYAGRALVPIRESLRRQREFAADASHELRTPLTIVRGSVEHLRRHADQPVGEVGDALADIEGEVDHLTGLVEDLLLLARSDSGAVELRREPVELADVAGEALQRLRPLAESRGVQLTLDAAPASAEGDPDRLRQLTAILVDNALRHTPAGRTVRVSVAPEGGHPTLTVDDEGPGIRPEHLPHVFDRFWRAPDAPAGGTGLGLAIASWIAEHHHATLSVANRPGGGARFVLSLPAHPARSTRTS
jgi:signal transduction histidine kinase